MGKTKISYKTLMRQMMAVLLDDKQERDEEDAENLESPDEIRARLAEAKAKRKADAIARSQARAELRSQNQGEDNFDEGIKDSAGETNCTPEAPSSVEER